MLCNQCHNHSDNIRIFLLEFLFLCHVQSRGFQAVKAFVWITRILTVSRRDQTVCTLHANSLRNIYTIPRILNLIILPKISVKLRVLEIIVKRPYWLQIYHPTTKYTKNVKWSLRLILMLIGSYETSNKRNSTDYDHIELSFRTKITLNCIYFPFKLIKETEIYSLSCSVTARCLVFPYYRSQYSLICLRSVFLWHFLLVK